MRTDITLKELIDVLEQLSEDPELSTTKTKFITVTNILAFCKQLNSLEAIFVTEPVRTEYVDDVEAYISDFEDRFINRTIRQLEMLGLNLVERAKRGSKTILVQKGQMMNLNGMPGQMFGNPYIQQQMPNGYGSQYGSQPYGGIPYNGMYDPQYGQQPYMQQPYMQQPQYPQQPYMQQPQQAYMQQPQQQYAQQQYAQPQQPVQQAQAPQPAPAPAPQPAPVEPTPAPAPAPQPTPQPAPEPAPAPAPQPAPTPKPAPAPQPAPTPAPAPEQDSLSEPVDNSSSASSAPPPNFGFNLGGGDDKPAAGRDFLLGLLSK